jgi:hypothetical protein
MINAIPGVASGVEKVVVSAISACSSERSFDLSLATRLRESSCRF